MRTWADGFATYLQSYEARLHRRARTFGGVVWPEKWSGRISPDRQLEIAVNARKGRTA